MPNLAAPLPDKKIPIERSGMLDNNSGREEFLVGSLLDGRNLGSQRFRRQHVIMIIKTLILFVLVSGCSVIKTPNIRFIEKTIHTDYQIYNYFKENGTEILDSLDYQYSLRRHKVGFFFHDRQTGDSYRIIIFNNKIDIKFLKNDGAQTIEVDSINDPKAIELVITALKYDSVFKLINCSLYHAPYIGFNLRHYKSGNKCNKTCVEIDDNWCFCFDKWAWYYKRYVIKYCKKTFKK